MEIAEFTLLIASGGSSPFSLSDAFYLWCGPVPKDDGVFGQAATFSVELNMGWELRLSFWLVMAAAMTVSGWIYFPRRLHDRTGRTPCSGTNDRT